MPLRAILDLPDAVVRRALANRTKELEAAYATTGNGTTKGRRTRSAVDCLDEPGDAGQALTDIGAVDTGDEKDSGDAGLLEIVGRCEDGTQVGVMPHLLTSDVDRFPRITREPLKTTF